MNKHGQPVIAIDGTSASGKSTLAEELAEAYGAVRIEYSLFFRLIALHMLTEADYPADQHHVPTQPEIDAAAKYARSLTWEKVQDAKNDPRLRWNEVSHASSQLAEYPSINESGDKLIRELIANSDKPVVAEGRTIGKYVYPKADVRLYVDANVGQRAERRAATLRQGSRPEITVAEVEENLTNRDARDHSREYQPTGYDDKVHFLLDTSNHTITQTLHYAQAHIAKKSHALRNLCETRGVHRFIEHSDQNIAKGKAGLREDRLRPARLQGKAHERVSDAGEFDLPSF